MEFWQICLEYLKILLTWPVAFFVISILAISVFKEPLSKWLSNMKIDYGGATFTTSQRMVESEISKTKKPELEQTKPEKSSEIQIETDSEKLKEIVGQWRANSYLWEYRFLNLFLVPHTQQILDWLYEINKAIEIEVADSFWRVNIPSVDERKAIFDALTQHFLVENKDKQIEITPKGREYVEFRGKVNPALKLK